MKYLLLLLSTAYAEGTYPNYEQIAKDYYPRVFYSHDLGEVNKHKVLGTYDPKLKRITILLQEDKVSQEIVLHHEYCHFEWHEERSELFRHYYKKSFYLDRFDYPTEYSKASPEEHFAESCMLEKIESM